MSGQLRGSIATLRKRWANPLPEDALDRVVEAIDIDGVRVNDVFCLGTINPEFITGSVTTKRDSFDRFANNLLRLEVCKLLDLTARPSGLPEADEVAVDFRVGR